MKVRELLTDLRGLTVDDLRQRASDLEDQVFRLRLQSVDGAGRVGQQDPAAAPGARAGEDRTPREGWQGLAMAKQEIIGTVVSNKMTKSVVVTIERQVRDEVYGKQLRLHVPLHGA